MNQVLKRLGSLAGGELLSCYWAVQWVFERVYGSQQTEKHNSMLQPEAITGFTHWLQRQNADERKFFSEYSEDAVASFSDIPIQALCSLVLLPGRIDSALCNKFFMSAKALERVIVKIARVFKMCSRFVATCPLAFGQSKHIANLIFDSNTKQNQLSEQAQRSGNPIRPEQGSFAHGIKSKIDIDQQKRAGFQQTRARHMACWNHSMIGSDLPSVLVFQVQR